MTPSPKRPARTFPGHKISPALVKAWRAALVARVRLPKSFVAGSDDVTVMREVVRLEHRNVAALWQRFTTERGQLSRYLMDPKKEAVAYLLGFHLPNVARAVMSLERAHRSLSFEPFFKALGDSVTITDFGCGTGALAQAVLHFLRDHARPGLKATVNLLDANGAFLDTARDVLAASDPEAALVTRKARLEEAIDDYARRLLATEGAHVIGLGYLWNELAQNMVLRNKVLGLVDALNAAGKPVLLFVTEPSNQMQARDMMEARDIIAGMGYFPVYPCRHAQACPMLERPRDWCYSEFAWQRPEEIAALDKLVGIDRSHLSAASYVFVSASLTEHFPVRPGTAVVVGRPAPRRESGKRPPGPGQFTYLLCHPDRLTAVPPVKGDERIQMRGEKFADKSARAGKGGVPEGDEAARGREGVSAKAGLQARGRKDADAAPKARAGKEGPARERNASTHADGGKGARSRDGRKFSGRDGKDANAREGKGAFVPAKDRDGKDAKARGGKDANARDGQGAFVPAKDRDGKGANARGGKDAFVPAKNREGKADARPPREGGAKGRPDDRGDRRDEGFRKKPRPAGKKRG